MAQLLISLSPLSAVLVTYWLAEWITGPLGAGDTTANRLGATLHVLGPARADESVFGAVPAVWLQERLVGGGPHWYDAVAAVVYVTHFLVIPVLTALIWFRLRDRFRAWIVAVLAMSVTGFAVYVAYPAAPPWLASERGDIGVVDRTSLVGWHHLGLDAVGALVGLGQGSSNPVAAMPSLHAAAALLVALFLWPSVGPAVRGSLLAYAAVMGLTLVATGEHYAVDVAAGWLVAAVAVVAARASTPAHYPGRGAGHRRHAS